MFEELGEESGIAFSNDTGALVYAETEDVLGGVHQTCQYPFYVVYRASGSAKERQKMSIQIQVGPLPGFIRGQKNHEGNSGQLLRDRPTGERCTGLAAPDNCIIHKRI